MTLRDFVRIFSQRQKLCLSLIVGAMLLALAAYRLQSPSYNTELILSVTRSGKDMSTDYRYHEFYRLQADERFSDSVVRYLATGEALGDIERRAGLTPSETDFFLKRGLDASRLSSNIVSVSTRVPTERAGEAVASAVPDVLNLYIANLNASAQEPDWFSVLASAPDITDARFSWREALFTGFIVGLFLAFWTALFDYYWHDQVIGKKSMKG